MSRITAHVLDTALGRPAADLEIRLDVLDDNNDWRTLGQRTTDASGRVADLLGGATLEPRSYRLLFETATYFARLGQPTFYPRIEVVFRVVSVTEHYHIPLLLSPFGYSTYRGS
jgi:5-hydroxyisourate hydrolase